MGVLPTGNPSCDPQTAAINVCRLLPPSSHLPFLPGCYDWSQDQGKRERKNKEWQKAESGGHSACSSQQLAPALEPLHPPLPAVQQRSP